MARKIVDEQVAEDFLIAQHISAVPFRLRRPQQRTHQVILPTISALQPFPLFVDHINHILPEFDGRGFELKQAAW